MNDKTLNKEQIKKMARLCRCTQCGNDLDVLTLCDVIFDNYKNSIEKAVEYIELNYNDMDSVRWKDVQSLLYNFMLFS